MSKPKFNLYAIINDYFGNHNELYDFITHYGSNNNNSSSLSFEVILMNNFDMDNDVLLSKNDKWSYGHLLTFRNSELDVITSYNSSDVYAIVPNEERTHSIIYIVSRNGGEYTLTINNESVTYNLNPNFWQNYITTLPEFNIKITKDNKTEVELFLDSKKLDKIWSYSFLS